MALLYGHRQCCSLTVTLIEIFRVYGSGYPGTTSRGVGGLGFPFYFWPVVWGGAAVGGAAYLHNSEVRMIRYFPSNLVSKR